jgi:hypothetical protein
MIVARTIAMSRTRQIAPSYLSNNATTADREKTNMAPRGAHGAPALSIETYSPPEKKKKQGNKQSHE